MKPSSLIIGRQPLIEAMEAGRAIDKILFQRNVSGESIGDIRKLAKESCADGYLEKPFNLEDVVNIVSKQTISTT